MPTAQRERGSLQRASIVGALCTAALVQCASALHAQPRPSSRPGLGFNWVRLEGAQACVSSVDLMNRIEERAGRILFVRTGEAVLTLDGYVRSASQPGIATYQWAVTFEISDAHGKVLGRRDLGVLEGADCEVVARAAELIFDLTLDPDGVLGTGIALEPDTQRLLDELLHGEPSQLDPATLPAAVAIPASSKPALAKPPPSSRQEPERPRDGRTDDEKVTLDLAGVGMLGALPGVAPGIALNVTIPTRAGLLFELGLRTFAEQSVPAQRAGGEARLGQQSASLVLCPSRVFSLLLVCAGAEYGRQSSSASGFSSARRGQSHDLVNLVAQSTLQLDLVSWLFVRASAALVLPLIRRQYVYDSHGGDVRMFRAAAVSARAELGLGLRM
jgi:hypothetical protein